MKQRLLIILLMLLPIMASAETVEINGIYYNLNAEERTAEVTQNPNGYMGAIVIQEEVEYDGITYKVESIGISAFEYCSVTSITMPNSIKYIRDQAFYNSGSITNIVMSNNIESIGHSAFCGLEKIEEINIPNSVKEIGEYAFCRCKSVESFNIPDGVRIIGTYTFYRCEQLSSIVLPSSINSIAWSAFRECYQLQEIDIPEGVLSIGGYAFFQCKQLAKVFLPSSLTEIGDHAFASCDDLVEITSFINTPFDIANTIFECYNKATLYIPKGTRELYENTKGWKRFANISELPGPSHLLMYLLDGEEYKRYEIEEGSEITPEPAPTKEGFTFSGWSDIPQTMPNHDVTVTGSFAINKYKLTYKVDGSVYKTYDVEYGSNITPETEPTKEGYTFSGWSGIPQTMPANDVTVTGTFTANKYKLTYMVDGSEYKAYDIEYGASITPEAEPTTEGYTFSGWSDIPSTMPANDVTITGSFTVNKYTLTYIVDGDVYKTYEIEYGATITPEAEPTKEGYTFSGWNDLPQTMPARDVTVTGSFSKGAYTLTYIVDGEVYKTVSYDYGASITPEAEPTKEGYTFSGWSYIPQTMPAEDVTVTGSFTVNKYTLTYMVDSDVYKTYEMEYGARITPEAEPTKEGYAFSGWSEIPQTMPAHDVTVTGTFTKGAYKLIYMVDGEVYKTVSYDYGETITPEAEPTKEGYTFSGWSNIPTTMPANDVTVTGTFTVNKYKLTYMVDGEVYKSYDVEYGATITPEAEPTKEGYKFSGWSYTPSKMPAEDVTVVGTFTQVAFVKDNVTYEMNGNDASVTHADNAKGEIVVEASVVINGKSYNVTSIADGAFQGCTGLTSIEIPATVTRIGENAFNGCSSLIVIKIGKDIKEIGSKAFANIGKSNARTRADIELRVYCEAEVLPSTAGDAFENSPIDKGTLYVNDDLIGVYKVVMPWNGFGTIVGLSTGIKSISIDPGNAFIFDMQGNRIDNVRKGVNIIRTRDGKTKKIVVK